MTRRLLPAGLVMGLVLLAASSAFGQATGGIGTGQGATGGTTQATLGGEPRGQISNELIARDPAAFIGTGGITAPIRSMADQPMQSVNSQFNPNVTFGATGAATGGIGGRTNAALGVATLGGIGGFNNPGIGGIGGLGGGGGLNAGLGRNQFGGGFNQFGNQFGQNQFGQVGGQTGNAQTTLRSTMSTPSLPRASVTPATVAQFENRLTKLPRLGLSKPIEATLEGRTLVLEGVVASESVKDLIARLATLEPGIEDVRNDLTVDPLAAKAPASP